MKSRQRSFVIIFVLVASALSFDPGPVNARDIGPTVAASHSAKRQCTNACRARYRDCRWKGQIPSFECRDVYQDCMRFSCNAVPSG
jgi:hypothetical protein